MRVGVEDMTIKFDLSEGGLKEAINHAIKEAADQTSRSDFGLKTQVSFRAGGQTVSVGPDDDVDEVFARFAHLEASRGD